MTSPKFDRVTLLKGLINHNYFPAQKISENELPPIINSRSLSPEVINGIFKVDARKQGYDQIDYRATRFNNVSRLLSIPHPKPYISLCTAIANNWEKFEYITKSTNSLITLKHHPDGRIIVMDYESTNKQIERHVEMTFNKKFYVRTDISNFFPSIYSHSVPWALVGMNYAKTNRSKRNLWFNNIDHYITQLKRNETNGIPIGPATSNIISEAILVRIDEQLISKGYMFIRFIDDYTGFFDTYEQAEEFIRILSEQLNIYKLILNAKKTIIEKLPCLSTEDWIVDLSARIPSKGNTYPSSYIRFLDYAVHLQGTNPDGSILKYASKSIIDDVSGSTNELVLKYLLGLCVNYPVLIPLLDKLFDKTECAEKFNYCDQLVNILDQHAINHRSDAMAWTLYYLNKHNQEIPKHTAELIIDSKDCISILMLYLSRKVEDQVIRFCNSIDKADLYTIDQYWLLLYQVFLDGKIVNPYSNINAYNGDRNEMNNEVEIFDILRKGKISFVETD